MHEDPISQIPALQLLQNMSYTYLSSEDALRLRGGKESNVILDEVLEEWLRTNNRIHYRNRTYPFTEGNIFSAVQTLKGVIYDGLIRTNEKIYDLICMGKSFQQSIEGDQKSFSLHYINWEEPEKNVYHVSEEFRVERTGSKETYVPDIVLFVNGIPLVVIECKRPELGPGKKDPMGQAISQHIRNQKEDGIPKLYTYSQLLMALSKNEAKYATTGTPMAFWSVWNEEKNIDNEVSELINKPLSIEQTNELFSGRPHSIREHFAEYEKKGREVTQQDRTIYSLLRPERLLELIYRYIIYDDGEKKIARYQQYFTVRNIMERIIEADNKGKRRGGVVWHTQGSGKSLTMVMLAKAIALEPTIEDHKIVLVTDRVDLDEQLYGTFRSCGKEVVQAKTGKHLKELIESRQERIIATVDAKFEAALGVKNFRNESPDIFVLVDEGHRRVYKQTFAKMKKALPNACFIGFTGTPVMKKDKNTVATFGGIIKPSYTIDQAVRDKSVVPLLYEGRHVEQKVDKESIDSWFERITSSLSKEQAADLKKKFATTDQLNKAEQKVMRIAWDISEHFRDNWQGTPFKAQLVTQDKSTALLYKKYLDEFGMVTSEVLISSPDVREGESDIYLENKKEENRFWKSMMEKYGTEKEYNKQLINAFKKADHPEIIIVVDKLITGFDEPRNTVLYLTRKLKEHTLLQAIARVNRLHEGKDFGFIIDYRGVLEDLDHAFDMYGQLAEYEEDDLMGTLTDVSVEIAKLPQRHSELWDIFKQIKNKLDEEAYERLLADDELRARFYDKFSIFARTLSIALSSEKYLEETPQKKIDNYNRELKFFRNLRTAVQRRYAEVIDFSEYEPKIQKLIDTHVGTGEVEIMTGLIDIFDKKKFAEEVERQTGDARKADIIAHRTKKTIKERMLEDPAFYKKFSELLEEAIRAFREERLKASEYYRKVKDIEESIVNRTSDDIPESLKHNDNARAYYGTVLETLEKHGDGSKDLKSIAADVGLAIDRIIMDMRIVNWIQNPDQKNRMKDRIEDYLFELKDEKDIDISFDDIDDIMEQCIKTATVRVP
jgi:type I restriction enzyme R subunit